MDALTLLQEHVDVVQLLEHYDFDKMRNEGVMIRSCCKLHGGNSPSAFVINSETGLWYCHTGTCGGGDIYTLVQAMEEISFPNAVQWVAGFFGVSINDLQITERQDNYLKEVKAWVKTMQSHRKSDLTPFILDVPVREVKKFRTFKEETLEHFSLGFVDEISLEKNSGGFYKLKNRLVIPIIQNGVQVGASLRKTKAQDFPKWSHQPLSIKTNQLLYNYDAVHGQPRFVIVEGALDVWAFHEIGIPAVATFGAHVTEEQYKLLMRTGADLIFAYDSDEAGQNATQKVAELFRHKANIECVSFADGKDPESVEREQLKLNYERRVKL